MTFVEFPGDVRAAAVSPWTFDWSQFAAVVKTTVRSAFTLKVTRPDQERSA